MTAHFRPAIVLILLFTLVLGVAMPLLFTTVAGVAVPFQAGGSLLERDGKVIGSALLGQNFTSDKYFQPRPSAITNPDPNDATKTVAAPYDASASAASNLAPTSKALIDRVTDDLKKLGPAPVPADAVTTSASGLDPDISPANALRQVAGVAKARNLSEAKVRALVAASTQEPWLGLIGEPRVNVLKLNLALDALPPG
jgi:potassium-transporting ATPase KdpC subunit